jgi:GDPmannose 4,6-dehydratase
MKKAIITGIGGQDGTFLAKYLVEKGYEVIGADRRRVDVSFLNLKHFDLLDKVRIVYFDLLEYSNIEDIIRTEQPDEFYNLGAQSFVKASFDMPILTSEVDAIGVLRILEAIRRHSPKTKFYQASTSEMFGKVQEIPQNENTPFYPRSPYGVAKLFAHWMVVNYRESYNLFACSGILFNHESEFRGKEFVTQKIINGVISILNGDGRPLELGNLDAKRDWGYAGDYIKGMYMMLQQSEPNDYVLATNSTISVREFVELAFKKAGINIFWQGKGIDEIGVNEKGQILVKINSEFYRPTEVDLLIGDYSKAKIELGWEPETSLEMIIDKMFKHALKQK